MIKVLNNLKDYLIVSYALGILIENDDQLYAIRKNSPLIVGVSKNGNFTGLKKNKLSKYINYYTSALEQARRYRDTIRLEFNSNNHTLMDLANTMSNIRNSKKGMAEDDAAFDLES